MRVSFLFILLLVSFLLKSQERDSIIYFSDQTSDVDSIKLKIAQYLVDNNELEPSNDLLSLYNSKVYITSLMDNKLLGFKKKGAFRIITTTSHSHRFLLLIDEHIKIIDYKNLGQTLNEVIDFLKKHDESDKDIAEYIQIILNEYKMNTERIKIKSKVK